MKIKFFRESFIAYILILAFAFFSCNSVNDDIPPENITDLSTEASSETISLQWKNPTDSDFSYAEIFISSNSKDNPYSHTYTTITGATSYSITDLYNNVDYAITIKAVDCNGNHSCGVSTEAVPNNLNGPAEVKNLILSYGEGEVTLTWSNPRDAKFSGVEITVINNDQTSKAIAEKYIPSSVTVPTQTSTTDIETSNKASATTSSFQTEIDNSSAITSLQEENASSAPPTTTAKLEGDSSATTSEQTVSNSVSTTLALTQTSSATSSENAIRKIKTDDANLEFYTIKDLSYGASYTFLIRTYDSDLIYSTGIEKTGTMPEESKGLKYKLSSDGDSYYVSNFTGDDSSNQTITIEQENGKTSNPITVTVFSTYNNKPVTAIGSEAFKDCRNIVSVILPSTITRIGTNAFFGCTALSNIILPENLKTISDGAFWNCVSLSYIVIPKSVTSIGLGATLNDVNLAHVLYTGSEDEWNLLLTNIVKSGNSLITGRGASIIAKYSEIRFNYNGSLPIEFTAPKNVTELTVEPGLSHVKLSWVNPNDEDFAGLEILAKSDDETFFETYNIGSHDVDSYIITGLTNNLKYSFTIKAFDNLKNYSSGIVSNEITPNLVEKFDEGTGYSYYISEDGCSCVLYDYALDCSTVVVPSYLENIPVTKISNNTFSKNNKMKILILPKTICEINETAIENCAELKDIYYEDVLENWILIDNVNSFTQNIHYNFSYDNEDIMPPAEVSDVKILKGDTKIGLVFDVPTDSDFYTVQISSVPESQIFKLNNEHYAATDLTNGQSYTFVIKTEDIYGNLSAGVSINAIAEEIKTEGKTKDGLLYKLISSDDYLSGTSYEIYGYEHPENTEVKVNINIPETINDVYVTKISADTFANYNSIASIFIPKSIEEIEAKSLSESTCLTSISIDSKNKNFSLNADGTILYKKNMLCKDIIIVLHSVSGELDFSGVNIKNILAFSFSGCNKITSLILPQSLEEIFNDSFKNCSELKIIILSDRLNCIGDRAFNGCEKLSVCYYSGSKEQWKNIKFNSLKNKALSNCKFIFQYKK